jgi:prolipoprotein diacylglyceryl transferase
MTLLGVLPSPSSGVLQIGPVPLRAYGLMIALGVLAAIALAGRRLERMQAGSRDEMTTIALWAVASGLVGARLYHVVTDWSAFSGNLGRIPMIWRGGLGIPGGLIGGVAAGLVVATVRRVDLGRLLTAVAPAIALGQSIGRWGNWWNQELFGKPTSLPWALEVSPEKVPSAYAASTTFHPTFLYESLWTLALCGVLLWIDRRFELRPGRLFAVYVLGYGVGRFWIEGLRIDSADVIAGLRFNQWVAAVAAIGAAVYLMVDTRHSQSAPPPDGLDAMEQPRQSPV